MPVAAAVMDRWTTQGASLGSRLGAQMSQLSRSGVPVSPDADWQGQFISEHMRRIFLQIYRMVGNAEDAQDLTQEVFIKALQRSDQIQDPSKAAHWLSRVATNTAIDFLRRKARVQFSELEELPDAVMMAREESPEQRLLRGEQGAWLAAGLEELSERERMALVLRDVEGLPAEEVALQMNCSKATVRSHIANARIKFRKYSERRKT